VNYNDNIVSVSVHQSAKQEEVEVIKGRLIETLNHQFALLKSARPGRLFTARL